MTTPISPAGTCTQGNSSILKTGHSLNRQPGISSLCWKPASPFIASTDPSDSRLPNRFVTSPMSVGPMYFKLLTRIMARITTTAIATMRINSPTYPPLPFGCL